MANQPIPDVTEEDVKRIAHRDFGHVQVEHALSILEEFGKQEWNRPNPRVQLAILKLANGNLDRLLDETKTAIEDYRDVLSMAEYPRYSREIGFSDVPKTFRQTVIEEDWRQYREWLDK